MTDQPPERPIPPATHIANTLGERDQPPRRQIARIVRVCGPEQALAWLDEALAIEAAGGMLVSDGSRRRTPGGTYFAHVMTSLRESGRHDLIKRIFWQKPTKHPGAAAPEGAPEGAPKPQRAAAERWEDRAAWMQDAQAARGKASTVKVTIIGRPGKVVEREGFVLFQLTHEGAIPALPKGLPTPAKMPATTYAVYVGAKQWRGVAEAIKQPDDDLIIEGVQWYDRDFEAIVVMATKTTTKALQRAAKQPPPAAGEQ